MAASRDFVELVLEQMASRTTARRMFGGVGIYRDGIMFALIADDVLYFKVASSNRHDFDVEGLEPFTYTARAGKKTVMSYRRAPVRCLEDQDSMAEWSRKAWAAACEKPQTRRSRKKS